MSSATHTGEKKFKHPIGSLVRVVKKGETSWAIQAEFLERVGIVIEHDFVENGPQFEGDEPWVMNLVMFNSSEQFAFYDIELVQLQ